MSESAELGELVRRFRHTAGLTLEDLAERSGVSVRTVSDLERGRSRSPHARTVTAIAHALRLPEDARGLLLAAARTARPRPAPAPFCELPPDIPDFTGRSAELAVVTAALADGGDHPAPVVISGAGGLGKTSLAVRSAYSTRGRFPDGRLFADLRGNDSEPLDPYVVQFRLLRALGVDADEIHAHRTDRGELLRRTLAERKALLLLDNAADEAQVRGLLPGAGGSAALITSRRALTGLHHVRRVTLGPLSDGDADDMLRAVIDDDAGIDRSPALIRSVTQLCGNYPLALRIAGNRLLSRPGWTLATLVDRLTDQESRLDRLSAGDLRIRAAFSVSYGQLDPTTRLVFRRLALVPGPDAGAALASVLTGLPVPDVDQRLDDLIELGLLVSAADQRAGFHDLIRLYAREQLVADDGADAVEQARRRLVSWLLATARGAGSRFRSGDQPGDMPPEPRTEFPDQASARRWLETESENWLGALRLAAGAGDDSAVVSTAEALQQFAGRWVGWRHWPEVFTLSATAAHRLGDPYRAETHGRYRARTEAAGPEEGS